MSRTIDEKVVSLEFDNDKFEKNVKTSLSTIEKLKQALKFDGATKGMEEVERASEKMNFESVSSSIEKVSVKFNVLQTAAVAAVTNITNKIVDMGLQLAQSLSGFNMIKAGYDKMDELNSSVQTLVNSTGKSTDEIMRLLNRFNVFSDETSYGLNDMVSAWSTMVASGGDVETLIPMIEGIANATAYAGKTATEFKRVMFNLTQSYSAGYLKYEDWKSVMLAGVNTKDLVESLIRAGEELGRIEEGTVTVSNFTETLKKKWADVEVMEKAFSEDFGSVTQLAHEMVESGEVETFTEAYKILAEQGLNPLSVKAAQAAQEAKTFKEVMDATTDAVSSKWMQMFATLIGNYDEAKKTWSQLAEDFYYIFADPLDQILNNVIKPAFMSRWDQFEAKIEETGLTAAKFEEELLKYDEANGGALSRLIDKYGSLKAAMSSGFVPSAFIVKFLDYLTSGSQVIGEATSKLEAFQKVFNDVWSGKYGNGEERIKKLTEAGYDYATVQGLINKLAKEGHRSGYGLTVKDIEDLDDAMLTNLGLTKEEIAQLRELAEQAKDSNTEIYELIHTLGDADGPELFRNILGNLTGTILNLQETAREAWDEVMDVDFAGILYRIVKSVSDFTDKIRELTTESSVIKNAFKLLYSGLKAVFSVFNLIKTVAGQIARGAFSIIGKILKELNIEIPEFTANLTSGIDNLVAWITDNDTIFNALDRIGDAIAGFIPTIKDWIKAFTELPFIQKTLELFNTSLQAIVNGELDFSKITKPIIDLKDSIINGTFNPLESLGLGVSNIFEQLSKSVSNYANTARDSVLRTLSPVLNLTADDWALIGKKFQSAFEVITGLGGGYMVLTALNKLADAAAFLLAPFKAFSDIAKAASGMFGSIDSYFKQLTKNTKTNNILKLGIAISILAGSLWLLAKLGGGELIEASIAMIAIATAIAILNNSIESAGAVGDFKNSNLPKVLLSLAASMLIIAVAMKQLDSLRNGWKSVGQLGAVLGGLIAAMVILNKFASGIMFTDFTKPILAFAVSLYIIAKAMKKLESVNLTWSTVGIIGLLSAVIAGLSKIASGMTKGQGAQIAAIALSLLIFSKILEKINKVSFEDAYGAIVKMLPTIGIIVAIMKASKGLSGDSYSAASIIVSAAGAVYLIGSAVEKLGKLDKDVLIKGGLASAALFAAIGTIGTGLAALLSTTNMLFFSFGKAAGMALLMITACASLYLMAGAILVFKNMEAPDLWKAVSVISTLLLALGGSLGLAGAASSGINVNTVSALGKMALVIGVLTAAIIALSFIPDTTKLFGIMGGLVLIIGSISLLMVVLSKFSTASKAAWIGLAQITLLLAGVTGAIYVLANFTEAENALKVAEALCEVLLSLSTAFVLIALAGTIAQAASGALVALPIALTAVLGIISILGLIAAEAGEERMNSIIAGVTKVGEAIGGFVGGLLGNLAGSLIESITNKLPAVGENLSTFARNVQQFLNLEVPKTFGPTLDSLIGMLTRLGGGNVQTYLKTIINNDKYMEDFSKCLMDYGSAVVSFSRVLVAGGINTAAVTAAAQVGEMFANLANSMPSNGLFAALFTGKESIAQFGAEMEVFAQSLVNVGGILRDGGFNKGTVMAATMAGNMLAEMANNLPDSNLFAALFTGKESLAQFGVEVETFAQALVNISSTLTNGGFKKAGVINASMAGKMLGEMANTLPEAGSLKTFLIGGEHSLSEFASGIVLFAKGLRDLCLVMNSTEVNAETIQKAKDAGAALNELALELPETGGIVSKEKSLSDFGASLGPFALGIQNFFTSLSGFNFPKKADAAQIWFTVGRLIDLVNSIGENAGKKGFITNFSNGLGDLGTAISDFSSLMLGTGDPNQQSPIASLMETIKGAFSPETTEEIAGESKQSAWDIFKSYIDGFTSPDLQVEHHVVMGNISNDTIDYLNKPEGATETLPDRGKGVSMNFIRGLIDGLKNSELIQSLRDASADLGKVMVEETSKAIESNSPSKAAIRIGEYFDEGLIVGVSSMTDSVEDSAYSSGLAMINGIKQSVALANSIIDDDLNPVITPVLDMSDVRANAGYISDMLGANSSYNAAMSIGGRYLSSGIQNGLNGQQIILNNTFTLNGVGDIQDPSTLNTLADRLADKINIILGNAL